MKYHAVVNKLHYTRNLYIMKTGENPDLCFISKNLVEILEEELLALGFFKLDKDIYNKSTIFGYPFFTILEDDKIFFTKTPQ